jgi:hypothetical protein
VGRTGAGSNRRLLGRFGWEITGGTAEQAADPVFWLSAFLWRGGAGLVSAEGNERNKPLRLHHDPGSRMTTLGLQNFKSSVELYLQDTGLEIDSNAQSRTCKVSPFHDSTPTSPSYPGDIGEAMAA